MSFHDLVMTVFQVQVRFLNQVLNQVHNLEMTMSFLDLVMTVLFHD
jgi:hypothetical protein